MKPFFYRLIIRTRRFVWGMIVAYMLGMHNFYMGDNKSADNILITTEVNEAQDDGMGKD